MSRFNSLEFGEQFDDQLPQQRELVKGEAFYLAEARSASNSSSALTIERPRIRVSRPGASGAS